MIDPKKISQQAHLELKHDFLLNIATGRSRRETNWKNIKIMWSELVKRLSKTHRTHETVSEYQNALKAKRDEIKDVGGFVGGALKEGRRKAENIIGRQIVTLDADFVLGDLWARFEVKIGCSGVMYSTHSHTPTSPRLRLVIPLVRPVTPDEYQAVSRKIAEDLGIDFFDDTTYEPHRLMYWPSTSIDGEYIFNFLDEKWLDPDEVLNRYDDWTDSSFWPESSRTNLERKRQIDKQESPREKKGIIGAFCRTYKVTDVIDKYLKEIYTPSIDPNRYTYIPGSSANGLIIYGEGDFAYSHHGTDPISGRLCNAFDLVRIHKFSYLDKKAKEDTPMAKVPSYLAMQRFALKDIEVKKRIVMEKGASKENLTNENWQANLEINKNGEIKNSLKNLITIIQNDPKLKGIVFNELSDGMEIKGKVPWKHPSKWWRDADDAQLISYIDMNYGSFSIRNFDIAVTKVADDRSYHPIREYLEALPAWDGVERLDQILIDYLGAENNDYVKAVTRKVFVAAVARVYNPGIKFDWMLVLSGEQGIGKSTLIQKLAGEWFNDSLRLSDTKDKTAAEKLQGYWILEIGELAGMRKAEENELKNFLSSQNDVYRASFGKRATPHPRQCIFIGTTNEKGYLRDATGNRRFWPVKVYRGKKKPWNITKNEIEQIWAEALLKYQESEKLQLSEELEIYANQMQDEALEVDERQGIIENYMEMLLPDNWKDMDLFARREYINEYHNKNSIIPKGTNKRKKISVIEIWCEAFGKNKADLKRAKSYEITKMLRRIEGWEQSDKLASGGIYGNRRIWKRKS
ncbi:Virulence-associated protein E [Desulfonispora thiosulfatigenes DSM 11270]|uniref:Virulence-associated protein E n=1 Tax=Desulfonispora thiosulfatigenes DSM 11270 TaxID=656914 RepID=A0A1W1V5P1_DESTI|nr:virulence-associated E family protein [Desulfonispora thiosulfatigenes]SMB88605.1 Virulence-associated protein E [Desulfonispora thiosulfatigenes DSM 11270]